VADWFATHSTAESINAGLDMEMPGWIDSSFRRPDISVFFSEKIIAAVKNRSVTEGRVDEMVRRVMTPYFYIGQDTPDYPSPDPVDCRYSYPRILVLQKAFN
jgi:beta-glucosidase